MTDPAPTTSYVTHIEDAADFCDEFSALEAERWKGYRDYRWQQPRDTANALRLLAVLLNAVEAIPAISDAAERAAERERLCDLICAGSPYAAPEEVSPPMTRDADNRPLKKNEGAP